MIVGIKTIASDSSISQMYASSKFFCIVHFLPSYARAPVQEPGRICNSYD